MLLFPSFCSRFLFEHNSFHLTIWYLSTTRRIRPAVPTPSHVPLSSTNCAERSRKNKEQKKPSYFIKRHDLSGIFRMTLQPGFPIQTFHLSSGRRHYTVFLTGNLLFLHEQNDFILIGIRNMTKIIFHHINASS